MRHRIYIAGPMRGYPLCNFPAFDAAADQLRERGHIAVNPADLDRAHGFDGTGEPPLNFVRTAFPRDVYELAQCSAILMLPGWECSQGAVLEHGIARMFRLTVFYSITEVPDATGRQGTDQGDVGRLDGQGMAAAAAPDATAD